MKLSIQIAGLCASGAFLCTALPGFYQQTKPVSIANMAQEAVPGMTILENVALSLAGALLAGFLGYVIGDILSNPKGNSKKQKKALTPQPQPLPMEPPAPSEMPAVEPIPYTEEVVPISESAPVDEA
jgi:hypothetical protein